MIDKSIEKIEEKGLVLVHSPLFPLFKKKINDSIETIIKEQVHPWYFLRSDKPLKVNRFNGTHICYAGIEFDGSPRNVFWSRYIEPFLENLCVYIVAEAVETAQKKDVDASLLLIEIKGLLVSGFHKTLIEMAKVDRRLRGKGYPSKVSLRSIELEFSVMREFVEEHIQGELSIIAQKRGKAFNSSTKGLGERFLSSLDLKLNLWGISFDLKRFFGNGNL